MSNGWIKEGENFRLSQGNIDRGWRLGEDALPDSERYVVTYDYYDGPIYSIWYINKNRIYTFVCDWGVEHEFSDGDMKNTPWKYFEGFAND